MSAVFNYLYYQPTMWASFGELLIARLCISITCAMYIVHRLKGGLHRAIFCAQSDLIAILVGNVNRYQLTTQCFL